MNTDFIKIAHYASKAPSGHNTQPWKFRITADAITVIPDLEVALPVVDGSNRELFISIGCAIENLCMAAAHFGYDTHFEEYNTEGIIARLTKSNLPAEDTLFHQIEKRQTNRRIYNGHKIPNATLQQLRSVRKKDHVQLYLFETHTSFASTLTEYIRKGNEIQMNDLAFKAELLSWMRFNKKQVKATQNGLTYRVFGNPPLPEICAKPVVNLFLKPNVQNKSDKKKIDSSSHFVVFTTEHNTLKEWIDLGRTLQHFLLKATETKISCAFLNPPCEIPALASALQSALPLHEEYPTLILRIGYAKPSPYSPRKKIENLLKE